MSSVWYYFGGTGDVVVDPTATQYVANPGAAIVSKPITITIAPIGGIWPEGGGTITVNDGGASGTFSDDTFEIPEGGEQIVFTYTTDELGPVTLTFSNDAGLTDPEVVLNVHKKQNSGPFSIMEPSFARVARLANRRSARVYRRRR